MDGSFLLPLQLHKISFFTLFLSLLFSFVLWCFLLLNADVILNQPLASVGGAIFGIFLGGVVNKAIDSLGGLIKNAT
jgi:hypothetical protein